jgi:AAA family ATP:ADP antiporter
MHFAVDRPTREVLYTVLGPEEKYKSKSFIDTFVYRAGDLTGVWVKRFAGAGAAFLWIALAISGAWFACALVLGALHRRHAARAQPVPAGAHEKAAPA